MSPNRPSDPSVLRPWSRPVLTRYRKPVGRIELYQTTTGVVNSIGCTDPDQCTGSGAAAPPPWMIPG